MKARRDGVSVPLGLSRTCLQAPHALQFSRGAAVRCCHGREPMDCGTQIPQNPQRGGMSPSVPLFLSPHSGLGRVPLINHGLTPLSLPTKMGCLKWICGAATQEMIDFRFAE